MESILTNAFEAFNQYSGWIVWNLFLAFIPLALSFWLFTKPQTKRGSKLPRRSLLWWAGLIIFIAFLPNSPVINEFPFISFEWLFAPFTVMPIQMFNWVSRPEEAFQFNAAAAGLVLVVMTLTMNALAIYLRYQMRKNIKW